MKIPELIKQKSYERIVYTLRRHPITFLPILGLFIILMLVPVGLYLIANAIIPNFTANEAAYPAFILTMSGYCISVLVLFFTQFIDYYLDLWVVTNDRIIDIEQFGLFSRITSELDLFRIHDVSSDITGLFSTMFNYGDVIVKTASNNQSIIFRNVSDPNTIRENLIKLSHEDRKYHYQNTKDTPDE